MNEEEQPKPRRRRAGGPAGPTSAQPAAPKPAAAQPPRRRKAAPAEPPSAAPPPAAPARPRAARAATARPAAAKPASAAAAARGAAAARPPAAPRRARPPAAKPPASAPPDADVQVEAPLPSFARPGARSPRAGTVAASRPADASARSTRIIDGLIARLPPAWQERAREYLVLTRMDRPIGALLLLWPTWWALWFAAGDFPPIGLLVIFTLGVFVMRSAGCVINDYADHGWLDAHVERTRGRPMAAGRVSKREALTLFASLLAVAFVLVLFTNPLTIGLAFVGAALALVYPFAKRVTHLAQVVLGAAFGWSIPMAFAAVTGTLPPLCWLLFVANILFSVIYDTEYAMVDRDEDIRVGAKSTAILFGDADRAILVVLMATFLLAMLLAGQRAGLGWPYALALAAAAGLFAWQQWLIRGRDRMACLAAFRNNNWVGFALWAGLVLALALH